MKATSDLHSLIKSMSMSEKRYFRIFSARYSKGEENYIRLFEAISAQDTYSEEAIKLAFQKDRFVRHLPSEKNYLYHHILDSLNVFHRNKTFLARYANLLISIELLYARGLFDQCKKLIRQAKEEAYRLEKISVLLILKRWETIIYIKDEDELRLNENIEEEIRLLEVLRLQYIMTRIAFNIQVQIDKGKATETFLTDQDNKLEVNYHKRSDLNSFWTRYYYYSGKGLIASARKDHPLRYECYKQIKAIMDNAPQFITDLPAIYHLNSNNLINVIFLTGKLDEADALIRDQRGFMQEYGVRNATLSRIVHLNACENELFLYYKTARLSEASRLIKEIEPGLKKTPDTFSPLLFDLLYVMAMCETLSGNYRNATRFLNRILNAEKKTNFRMELKINTRLLYLLVLQRSGDVLFDARLNSTRRFLAQEPQFRMQHKILEAIAAFEDPDKKKRAVALSRLIKEIEKEKRKAPEEAVNKQFDFAAFFAASTCS